MSNFELKDLAWKNASSFESDNPKEFKVCYVCYGDFVKEKITKRESRMQYDAYDDGMNLNGWVVDHIDGNKKNNDENNIIAIHYDCHRFKKNQNFTELYLEYKDKTLD